MVFNGYIDESGNGDIFALSCVFAQRTNWMWFMQDWQTTIDKKNAELRKSGRKEISRYHASDCNCLFGDFESWTRSEQIEFTKSLVKVFSKPSNHLTVVSYALDLHELVEEIPETAPDPYGFAYSLLLKMVMVEIGHMITEAPNGDTREVKVPLIYDRCPYDGALLQAFNSLLADSTFRYPRLFTTIAPKGWEDCPNLQPADLLAYENFKESERRYYARDREMRRSLEALLELESFGGRAKHMDRNSIRTLKELMDERTAEMLRKKGTPSLPLDSIP